MAQKAIKWFRLAGISLITFLLSLYLLAWIFEDKLGGIALDIAKSSLKTELKTGKVNVSFIRAFPRIRASFSNVLLFDLQKDTLLSAEYLGVNLSWTALWSDDVTISGLVIKNGFIHIAIDSKGRSNYVVWKEPETKDAKNQVIHLQNTRLNNLVLHYRDDKNQLNLQTLIQEGTLGVKIDDPHYQVYHDLIANIQRFTLPGLQPIQDLPLVTSGSIRIDLAKDHYRLDDTEISLAGLKFKTDGHFSFDQKGTWWDIKGSTGQLAAASFWKLLDQIIVPDLREWDPSGEIESRFVVKGFSKASSWPGITADLTWKEGTLSFPKSPGLSGINLHIKWDQPQGKDLRHARLDIRKCLARVSGQPFQVTGNVNNFLSPEYDLHINGDLPVPLIQSAVCSGQRGLLHCRQVHLSGNTGLATWNASGNVQFEDTEVKIYQEPIYIPSGIIKLQDNNLAFDQVAITVGESDFTTNATVIGLIQYLSKPEGASPVLFNGNIHTASCQVEPLIHAFDRLIHPPSPEMTSEATLPSSPKPTANISGKVTLKADAFHYRDIKGKAFEGEVVWQGEKVTISGDADAMQGHFNFESYITLRSGTSIEGLITCSGINVKETFRQCRDFGQDFITKDHISGSLSTQLFFETTWPEKGTWRPEDLHVYAALQIDNGEIVNLKVLESFADYVRLKDLRHVRFQTLQNYLEILDGKIYLPRMLIHSNAMSMDLAGTHGFDHRIDYNMKVDGGRAMMNKLVPKNTTLAPEASKREGWFNLHFHLSGSTDNVIVKSDRPKVRANFAQSMVHRARIRAQLLDAFNTLLFDDELPDQLDKQTPIAANTPVTIPGVGTFTPQTKKQDARQAGNRKESDFLDDIEIIGGSGKKD